MNGRKAGRPVDQAARRRGTRSKLERGIRVYIPAECLRKAGVVDFDSPLYYRAWGAPGGRVLVNLYSEP